MEDDTLKDTRTHAQKIGDTPSAGKTKQNALDLNGLTGAIIKRPPLNAAAKAKRNAARDLALDYAEMAILAAVETIKNETGVVRMQAVRFIAEYSLGKPTTVHTDQDGNSLLPNLIIVTGNQSNLPTITAQYSITEDDEEDNDQEGS